MKHKKVMDNHTQADETWKHSLESSKNKKMPRGAQNLCGVYTVPHKDQWRRKVQRHKKSS